MHSVFLLSGFCWSCVARLQAANTKTRCLRITQKEEKVVRSKLNAR
jgi:hypothetical protein